MRGVVMGNHGSEEVSKLANSRLLVSPFLMALRHA